MNATNGVGGPTFGSSNSAAGSGGSPSKQERIQQATELSRLFSPEQGAAQMGVSVNTFRYLAGLPDA